MGNLSFWDVLIQEEVLADQIQQQGYTYPEALGIIKRYGVDQVMTMVCGDLSLHLETNPPHGGLI